MFAVGGYAGGAKAEGRGACRIEDTDTARSTRESEDAVLRDLTWLGIEWDEGVLSPHACGLCSHDTGSCWVRGSTVTPPPVRRLQVHRRRDRTARTASPNAQTYTSNT